MSRLKWREVTASDGAISVAEKIEKEKIIFSFSELTSVRGMECASALTGVRRSALATWPHCVEYVALGEVEINSIRKTNLFEIS